MNGVVTIGNREIGRGYPTFIIAEASSNHGRDIARAKKMIDVAARAGADAVKFQLFIAELIAADTDDPRTIVKVGDQGAVVHRNTKLIDFYRDNELPREWLPELVNYARKQHIMFLASPFDEAAVDSLEAVNVPAYKIASYELLHAPLLKRIAKTGKPVIVSVGMATIAEIEVAVEILRRAGTKDIVILHCHSGNPVKAEDVNLRAMETIARAFGCPVGYSDHTLGLSVPIAAVALGAAVIEKHFLLDDGVETVDEGFSLASGDFQAMVKAIRDTEKALGRTEKIPSPREIQESVRGRRSLWIVKSIKKHTRLTEKNIKVLRPGLGISPLYYDVVIGAQAVRNLTFGKPLEWRDITVRS